MPDDLDRTFSAETLMELGKLQIKMARSPKQRAKLLSLVKEFDPNYQLPADMQVLNLRQELANKFEQDKVAAEQKAIKDKLERQRAGLLTGETLPGRTFEEAQLPEIEKVMEKYGLSDYEAGAKLYASDLKPQRPAGSGRGSNGATWTFPDLPGLMDDPNGAARNAAYSVIDELQGARR